MNVELKTIGIIRSPFTTREETPIQGALSPDTPAWVELFPEYVEGLKDIETFSHIYLIYLFDRAGPVELVRPTFLDDYPPRNLRFPSSREAQRYRAYGSAVAEM